MNRALLLGLIIIIVEFMACKTTKPAGVVSIPKTTDSGLVRGAHYLEDLLEKYPSYFRNILNRADSLKVQIIYTRIDRDENNNPSFRDFYYRADPNAYFYPASTVKMPVALLALQRLAELKNEGVNRQSIMITRAEGDGQTAVYNDPQSPGGSPTIENYIKKIFLVSDNDAYNRLYEFLGPEYINGQLHRMGYPEIQIIHRLSVPLSPEQNRRTNPISFFDTSGLLIYDQPGRYYLDAYSPRQDSIGTGYLDGDRLREGPMNFSNKNRISLASLHQILRSVIFPESVPEQQRFKLSEEDYSFVRKYMSQYPSESEFPVYHGKDYYDTYCKFLLFGADRSAMVPPSVRVFNKVGDAYGFLLDISYIADFEKGVEFLLSAVIYCNQDGILNDDIYDYDSVGYPFLKHLGEVIYQDEINRTRAYRPNLSSFLFDYRK